MKKELKDLFNVEGDFPEEVHSKVDTFWPLRRYGNSAYYLELIRRNMLDFIGRYKIVKESDIPWADSCLPCSNTIADEMFDHVRLFKRSTGGYALVTSPYGRVFSQYGFKVIPPIYFSQATSAVRTFRTLRQVTAFYRTLEDSPTVAEFDRGWL